MPPRKSIEIEPDETETDALLYYGYYPGFAG
jgi:hypothetical protein